MGEEKEAREQQKASEACLLCWRVSVKVEEEFFVFHSLSLSPSLSRSALSSRSVKFSLRAFTFQWTSSSPLPRACTLLLEARRRAEK